MDYKTAWLCTLLHCGPRDMEILEGINYCIEDIVEECGNISLNNIIKCVMDFGISDLEEAVSNAIEETEDEAAKDALKELDPQQDVATYVNQCDSSITIVAHHDVYKKYLSNELRSISLNMGFEFEYGGDAIDGSAAHSRIRKAVNIQWDTDDEEELEDLPSEIVIPDEVEDDEIEDYISDETGFCHKGFDIVYEE